MSGCDLGGEKRENRATCRSPQLGLGLEDANTRRKNMGKTSFLLCPDSEKWKYGEISRSLMLSVNSADHFTWHGLAWGMILYRTPPVKSPVHTYCAYRWMFFVELFKKSYADIWKWWKAHKKQLIPPAEETILRLSLRPRSNILCCPMLGAVSHTFFKHDDHTWQHFGIDLIESTCFFNVEI